MSISGYMRWPGRGARLGEDEPFSGYDGGVRVASLLAGVVQVPVLAEVLDSGHIIWLPLRWIRQWQERLGFGGPVWPRGMGSSVVRILA